jgi:hypothetical protein
MYCPCVTWLISPKLLHRSISNYDTTLHSNKSMFSYTYYIHVTPVTGQKMLFSRKPLKPAALFVYVTPTDDAPTNAISLITAKHTTPFHKTTTDAVPPTPSDVNTRYSITFQMADAVGTFVVDTTTLTSLNNTTEWLTRNLTFVNNLTLLHNSNTERLTPNLN